MKWVSRLREGKKGPSQPLSPTHVSSDSDLEQHFKELWEHFRAVESDKGKNPNAFGEVLAAFCSLLRANDTGSDVLDLWSEARPFAFMVGRRFVSEIEQLRKGGPEGPLDGEDVLDFLAGSGEDSQVALGPNLLSALEALVAPPVDGGPLVDAGLLSCLVTVLYRFLSPANPPDAGSEPPPGNKSGRKSRGNNPEGLEGLAKRVDDRRKRLSVEGSIVHIMKALAQHPSAAQSLVEDHSLQLLFCIVAIDMGATGDVAPEEVGSPTKGERIKPQLHKAQLRRHAMQVVHLLLASDGGAMPPYLRKHRLIERLVTVVKEFDPATSDPAFAIGAVSLLVECIRLSSRPGSTVILREDFQAADGYRWIARLALKLTEVKADPGPQPFLPDTSATPQAKPGKRNLTGKLGAMVANLKHHGSKTEAAPAEATPAELASETIQAAAKRLSLGGAEAPVEGTSPSVIEPEAKPEKPALSVPLSRLLDLIIELAQIATKPEDDPASIVSPGAHRRTSSSGGKRLPSSTPPRGLPGAPAKSPPHRSFMPTWALSSPSSSSNNLLAEASRASGRLKDRKAAQLLQEIFLETPDLGLRLEILERLLGLISGVAENKEVLEELRTLPVLVKGVPEYPGVLQEELLAVLEYAGTLAGLSIEQELLSLVFFLQGPSVAPLGERFLATCVRLLRFDPQYAATLRDCGLLDVLIEDLRNCGAGDTAGHGPDGEKPSPEAESVNKSPGAVSLFAGGELQTETTWEALVSILRGSPENQKVFRKAGGFEVLLPLLGKPEALRGGALRLMGCLVSEDRECAHTDELGGLINVARTGHVHQKGAHEGGVPVQVTWQGRLEALQVLRGVLVENESAREAFRNLEGFSLPLALLVGLRRDEGAGTPRAGGRASAGEGEVLLKRFERQRSELHPNLKLCLFEALLQVLIAAVKGNSKNRQALSEGVGSLSLREALSMAGLISPESEARIVDLFFALALETEVGTLEGHEDGQDVGLEERRGSHQRASSSGFDEGHSRRASLDGAPASRRSSLGKEGWGPGASDPGSILNPSAIKGLILSLSLFSEAVQKQVLGRTKELALKGPRNREVLCAAGLFGLLLDDAKAKLHANPVSDLLILELELAEILGAFRLSPTELRSLLALVKPSADPRTSAVFLPMVERMAKSTAVGDTKQHAQNPSLAPFLDFSLGGVGHACVRTPLHERAWPHSTGYSFACWVKFQNLRQTVARTVRTGRATQSPVDAPCLRLFTVGPADEKGPPYLEVAIECSGLLVLTAGPKERLVFTDFTFEEDSWYHIAVVHNRPSALAGLFQSSVASLFVDGVGRQMGKLAAAAVPPGRPLLATLGTPPGATLAPGTLTWQLGGTYFLEEVVPPAAVFFMYALGRGYRGLFQDITLPEFLPQEVAGGITLKVMQSLEELAANPSMERTASGFGSLGEAKEQVAVEMVWDKEAAGVALAQLAARHIVFAFDGSQEEGPEAGQWAAVEVVNLVDAHSSAASISGSDLPRSARLLGNVQVCRPCSLADSVRHAGGVSLLLALIQTATTPATLRLALSLLVSAVRHNPKNAHDMARLRGYHLLAVFLRQHIDMVGHSELDLLLQLAGTDGTTGLFHHRQAFGGVDDQGGAMHTVVLTDPPLVEDVLLDWTVWVAAPVPLQLAVLDFLESLAGHSAFKRHNMAALRRMDVFQHLLVTLHRGDVTEPVLQKAVRLLGLFIEDGKHPGELKAVADFVVSTFRQGQALEGVEYGEPRKPSTPLFVPGRAGRESDGYEVLVRNMVLDKLLDLQVKLRGEEELDLWGKIVGSRVVTFLLDEDVHPSTLCLVLTMLAYSISANPASAAKFRASGGFQSITHVLPSFFDEPEVYAILLKLALGRPVYPRQPAMGLEDFYALIPTGDGQDPVHFPELLEIIGSLFKAAFDAHDPHPIAPAGESSNHKLVAPGVENGGTDLSPRTTDSRGSTPEELATGLMQWLVKLAQRSGPLSQACRRQEFLEGYVELFFSCVRSHALDMAPSAPLPYVAMDLDTGKPAQLDVDVSEYASFSTLPKSLDGSSDYLDLSFRSPLGGPAEGDHSSYASGSTFAHDTGDDRRGLAIRTAPRTMADVAAEGFLDGASSTGTRTPAGGTPKTSGVQSPIMISSPAHPSSPYAKGGSFNGDLEIEAAMPHGLLTDALLQAAEQSPGAQAVLDLLAVVLADALVEQSRSSGLLDTVLDAVPLDIAPATAIVFHGLCLQRLIAALSLRFEDVPASDKSKWAHNLEALSWLLVDRFHLGAFAGGKTDVAIVEFLLERLRAANVDGKVEEATVAGGSSLRLLALPKAKGAQVEPHVVALLKNLNRMIMYTFLPAAFRNKTGAGDKDGAGWTVDKAVGLLLADKKLVLCQSNVDAELMACLAYNLNEMLLADHEEERTRAIAAWKVLLLQKWGALEELLTVRSPAKGVPPLDVLRGGIDLLLTNEPGDFFQWLSDHDEDVRKVLSGKAASEWAEYVATAVKFPAQRGHTLELKRRKEMGRRMKERAKSTAKFEEQALERRLTLGSVRLGVGASLRLLRQDKYGWVLHAEREWGARLESLVHERAIWGILPGKETAAVQWQLDPTEGPYRMRKKLQRVPALVDFTGWAEEVTSANDAVTPAGESVTSAGEAGTPAGDVAAKEGEQAAGEGLQSKEIGGIEYFHKFSVAGAASMRRASLLSENGVEEEDEQEDAETASAYSAATSKSRPNTADSGAPPQERLKIRVPEGHTASDLSARSLDSSPRRSSAHESEADEAAVDEDLEGFEDLDDGEHLIRPYLEPRERIKGRYNCERVVGLDKRDGVFLIGDLCLYIIEGYFINGEGRICEKRSEDQTSVLDRALGVGKEALHGWGKKHRNSVHSVKNTPRGGAAAAKSDSPEAGGWQEAARCFMGGHFWALGGGVSVGGGGSCRAWKVDNVHEVLKRRYQLRPVALELFSLDGCNDLLVFHQAERDDVFKQLLAHNIPRANTHVSDLLGATISGGARAEAGEPGRLFKIMARSFSKRWVAGEISNFQYLMHLNTLAGRGYNDLTQYPVFPWVLADYESAELDLSNPATFRRLDRPMGALDPDREEEFQKRFENWEDPDIPPFHYGSHYSSAGTVLYYLVRLPPFNVLNQQLQGGKFDHADRMFVSLRDTWRGASQGNTADVKELTPEFFYMPEFLENRSRLDLGAKQSGEKVDTVKLPPWAHGSAREFVRKHREALESAYVSEHLHHWVDLIFGYQQQGKAAEEATNVFFYLTYEGAVDIDAVTDPAMRASILAQINYFGQTPRQLFQKPHGKRKAAHVAPPVHALKHYDLLVAQELKDAASGKGAISQLVFDKERLYAVGAGCALRPPSYSKYFCWRFPDKSVRIIAYDGEKLQSTHEALHDAGPVLSGAISKDGRVFVTGGSDGVIRVWHMRKDAPRGQRRLILQEALCAHTGGVTCLAICQTYGVIVSGSEDKTVVVCDLNTLRFVRQLAELQHAVTTVHVDDLTGEIVTGAGGVLCVWSVNGDCLAAHGEKGDTCQPGEEVLSVTTPQFSDHLSETNLYVSGHADGSIKLWGLEHRVVAAQLEQGARKVSRERRSLSMNVSALQHAAQAVAAVDKSSTFTDFASAALQTPQPPPSPSVTIEDLLKDHIMKPVSEEGDTASEDETPEKRDPLGVVLHAPRRRSSDHEPKQGASPRVHGGPEYRLVLKKVLTWHSAGVSAVCVAPSLKALFSGDRAGRVVCWALPEDGLRDHFQEDSSVTACSACKRRFALVERRHHCCNCGRVLCAKCCSRKVPLEDLGYFTPVRVCQDCYELRVRGTSKVEGPPLVGPASIPKPSAKPVGLEGAGKRSKSPKKHSVLEKIGSTRW